MNKKSNTYFHKNWLRSLATVMYDDYECYEEEMRIIKVQILLAVNEELVKKEQTCKFSFSFFFHFVFVLLKNITAGKAEDQFLAFLTFITEHKLIFSSGSRLQRVDKKAWPKTLIKSYCHISIENVKNKEAPFKR